MGQSALALVVVGGVLLAACGGGGGSAADAASKPVMRGEGVGAPVPASSLQDWRDFSDQVAVVTVTAESEQDAGDGAGGRTIGRHGTLTLTRRLGGDHAPDTIELELPGWFESENGRRRIVFDHGSWPEQAHEYLVSLYKGATGEWQYFGGFTEIVDGKVDGTQLPDEGLRELVGLTVDEVEARLVALAPSEGLAAYSSCTGMKRASIAIGLEKHLVIPPDNDGDGCPDFEGVGDGADFIGPTGGVDLPPGIETVPTVPG